MILKDVIIKKSLDRLFLHHLKSAYYIEVNQKAIILIEDGLRDFNGASPDSRFLVNKLRDQGIVDEISYYEPIPQKNESNLVSLEIEPVGACNLNCKHCFVEFSKKVMDEKVFREIVTGIDKLGIVEVIFNGGEPLLHPFCLDWLKQLSNKHVRLILYTNGTLVTEEVAEKLASANLAKINISLDGFKVDHDFIRGQGNFDRAVHGIKNLQKAGLKVYVTCVVYPDSFSRLEEFKKYCLGELKVSGMRLSSVIPFGKASDKAELVLPDKVFDTFYREQKSAATKLNKHLPCRAGVDKLFVSAEGKVYGCHLFEVIQQSLGSLDSQSLSDIYLDIYQHPFGKILYDFDAESLKDCRSCSVFSTCYGGCRARAASMNGDIFSKDPISCQRFLGNK